MEELKKSSKLITVREHLNTLDTENFAQVLIFAISNLELRYINTELDASDIAFSVEYDTVEWLNSPYREDKELLPSENIEIDENELELEDLDD